MIRASLELSKVGQKVPDFRGEFFLGTGFVMEICEGWEVGKFGFFIGWELCGVFFFGLGGSKVGLVGLVGSWFCMRIWKLVETTPPDALGRGML